MSLKNVLSALTFTLMLVALYVVFLYAPTERTMGEVQRIFYFHVSSAWTSFLAMFFVLIYSIQFLRTGSREYDVRAASAAEVGAVFCSLILVTGPLWAKPVWGIWWTWDPRLTSSFLLWLIYMGYIILRRVLESPERKARLSAVFGIIGAVDVPIVYMSNRWWRTQHPQPVMAGGGGLDPQMRLAFLITLTAFTLLYIYLWTVRCDLERSSDVVESLQRQLQIQGMEAR